MLDDKKLCIMLGAAPTDMHAAILAKARECLDKMYDKTGREFDMPSITYNLRGKRAGIAKLKENEIVLNIELLLDDAHYDEMLNQTLPHEMAHLIHHQIYPTDREWHGPRWKYIMMLLEVPPALYHNMPTKPVRKTRKFVYYCPCGKDHKIGLNRHRKIQNAEAVFVCRHCERHLSDMNWTEVDA